MTAEERKRKKTFEYLSNKNNFRLFVLELQEYIDEHMKDGCGYREDTNSSYVWMRHFIRYCNIKKFGWETVYEFFQDENNHWCRCDCDFINKVKVDEIGNIIRVE